MTQFRPVTIEIINTGSELMLGFVLNTHQQWLCRQLANLGYTVQRQVAISDSASAIRDAVREALSRSDLIITTGGLGPTSDDITRQLIAELLGRKLNEDPMVLANIEKFFCSRRRAMTERTKVQALVPEGATVLPNSHGTAPGLLLEIKGDQFRSSHLPTALIMLPGPPRELQPMFLNQVVPWLKATLPLDAPYECRIFKTTGLGESLIEDKIASPLHNLVDRGLDLGYCAKMGEVEVRLAARGSDSKDLLDQAEHVVRSQIGKHIFSADGEDLESVVIQSLSRRNETLATAESCTGGVISHCLTNVFGSSAAFLGGVVTYSNEAKVRFLGVRSETLSKHGAVSEATAREMAENVRARNNSTFGLAVTGIAGPTGGSPEKPVGTVFIALASSKPTIVLHYLNPYDRPTFKFIVSRQALDLLRRSVVAD